MRELDIAEIQAKLQSGELTARQLADFYLERIAALDQAGPRVNSVIELNPDAHEIAGRLDEERQAGKVRGPLHGVPILLKDNIDTADRMQTTAGSLALEGNFARRDAGLVKRLRRAGALILGKTNLSEWANYRGKRSTSGWSSRGGLTRNPHALDRTACGSSSGSAAAVAANFCAAAVGTETDGSIICPSQTNGIVGIKPTLGLISRSGVIPIAHSQDTPGPMARSVADAALLLGFLAGPDTRDPITGARARNRERDYTSWLDPAALKGARLGVARSLFGTDTRVLAIMETCLDAMQKAGARLIDVEMEKSKAFEESEREVLLHEFRVDLDAYLKGCSRASVHSLEDVIRFNEENRARVLRYFGQERMEAAREKGSLRSKTYLSALRKNHRLARQEGIDGVMKKHHLKAIVLPSGGPAWLIDLVNGDGSRAWDTDSTSHAAVAGYPHITVPAGMISGLPVGISFIGRAWQEPVLIGLAFAFEQLTQARRTPAFRRTVKID